MFEGIGCNCQWLPCSRGSMSFVRKFSGWCDQQWPFSCCKWWWWWVGRMGTSKLQISAFWQENEAGAGAIEARFLHYRSSQKWIELLERTEPVEPIASCLCLRFGACRSMSRAAASLWERHHFLCRCSDWDTFRINLFCREFARSSFDCYDFPSTFYVWYCFSFLLTLYHIAHNTLQTLSKDLFAITPDLSHYCILP